MYGEEAPVYLHGPDDELRGGFGAGIRVNLVQMRSTDPAAGQALMTAVLIEGLPGEGMEVFDVKWSADTQMNWGRGFSGPQWDRPQAPGPGPDPAASPGPSGDSPDTPPR